MKIDYILTAKDYVLYVVFEDETVLMYNMSDMVENDLEYYELKYYPEVFVSARPTCEGRSISWGDNTSISAKIIEECGQLVNIGYLELTDIRQLEEMQKHSDVPIVKKALENYYNGCIILDGRDFADLYDWASTGAQIYFSEEKGATELSILYECMEYNMEWLSDKEDWWDYYMEKISKERES
ncbi:MAG: hypothetical protein K6B42_02185 [Clostridia bacterium]|nr:hypothetical protein [Clostridia bacterium]